jgi:hypothetical protein
MVEGDGSGIFRVLGAAGVRSFTSGAAALAEAESLARASALAAAEELGAANAQVQLTVSKHRLPDAVDDNGLISAAVRAEAIGRPDTARSLAS